MKRVYAAVVLTCAAVLILYGVWIHNRNANVVQGTLKVGFIYENDEITPYTYNFSLARDEVEKAADRLNIRLTAESEYGKGSAFTLYLNADTQSFE